MCRDAAGAPRHNNSIVPKRAPRRVGVCCLEESSVQSIAKEALANFDCGKGWVRVSEIEPTIEVLGRYATNNNDAARELDRLKYLAHYQFNK